MAVQRVRLERIARGIKAYVFAAMVEYAPQLWRQVELGLREPPQRVAERAAEILGVPAAELFRPAQS